MIKILNLPNNAVFDIIDHANIKLYIDQYFHKFDIKGIDLRNNEQKILDINIITCDIDILEEHKKPSMYGKNKGYESYDINNYTDDWFIFILCEERDYLKIKILYEEGCNLDTELEINV